VSPPASARAAKRKSLWVRLAALAGPVEWAESGALVAGAVLATLHAEWRIVSQPLVYQTDATIHEFWMRRYQDPALFHDPLTNALLATDYEPPGYRGLYFLASHVVDPVFFGELLPLLLQPVSVLFLFWIVRSHVAWRPAAWFGAVLFLLPWDILRFSGGHPRSFEHAIVLLTVLLLVRHRNFWAALVPALGFLFYPPGAAAALGIVILAASARNRRFFVDYGRAAAAGVAVGAFGIAALATRLSVGSIELLTADEARRYPEFGPDGQMHFFASSTLRYLKQNYSGFSLRESGSILAVAAVGLILVRPRNAKLLRWEVWCMPIVALTLFAAAQAVLFRLYLPQRYTYPLLPFFCIAIAVSLAATFKAWVPRRRVAALLSFIIPLAAIIIALTVFPLGPQGSLEALWAWLSDARAYLAGGLAAGVLGGVVWALSGRVTRPLAATSALVAGGLLCGAVAFAGGLRSPGAFSCGDQHLYRYLRTLPPDAIIAGDPADLNCVPIAGERAVVISKKLYQPWDPSYFRIIRPRMFNMIDAYYGPSLAAAVQLEKLYGADYLVVRRPVRRNPAGTPAPFGAQLARLRRSDSPPAALQMPGHCATWHEGKTRVYRLACVATELGA
jgi:hypothetical protein